MTADFQIRILWLTENYPPKSGGMAQSCDRLVRSLSERGVEIDVLHFCSSAKPLKVVKRLHGNYISCPVDEDPGHAMNLAWNLIKSQHAQAPYTHVVAFGGWLPIIAAPVYSAWLQAPLVVMLRGNDFDTALFSPKRGDVLREALTRSSVVCAVDFDKARKVKLLYPSLHVVCTANGIDLTDWKDTESDRTKAEGWRADHVPLGKIVLGLFGHLKTKKGCAFFLEALQRTGLTDRFHLLLAGEVEPQTLTWLQSQQTITYTIQSYLDRYALIPFFLACDWIVFPSFYDGLPNVLLESGALGIPALASRTGGLADALSEGEDSVLFEPGDLHNCAAAICRVAQMSGEESRAFGKALRKAVVERFDVKTEAQAYLDLFMSTKTAKRTVKSEVAVS